MVEQDACQSLGETVRSRRLALGWSQEALAARMVAHGDQAFRQADVSRIEKGRVTLPRRDRLEHLAAVLGMPPGELLASSGWGGAQSALPSWPERPAPPPMSRSAAGGGREGRSPQQPPDLHMAIARARETRDRARAILRECDRTRALLETPYQADRPHDTSE